MSELAGRATFSPDAGRASTVMFLTTLGWWLIWYLVARLRFIEVGRHSTIAVFAMLSGLSLGFVGARLATSSSSDLQAHERTRTRPSPTTVFLPVLVAQLVFIARNWQVFFSSIDYRAVLFTESALLFGSSQLFVIYMDVLRPVMIFGAVLFATNRRSGWVDWSSLVVTFVLDSLVTLGRFPLYWLLFFIVVRQVIHGEGATWRPVVRVVAALVGMVGLSIAVLLWRENRFASLGEGGLALLSEIFTRSVVDYHLLGFPIFERMVGDTFHTIGAQFPHLTLAWFDYVGAVMSSQVAILYDYPWQEINGPLSYGIEIRGYGIANAFGTNLLPLYLDGGALWVWFVHAVGGALIGVTRSSSTFQGCTVMTYFCMIFGIFQPIITMGLVCIPLLLFLGIETSRILSQLSSVTPNANVT